MNTSLTRNRKIVLGVLAAFLVMCGVVGISGAAFRMGAMRGNVMQNDARRGQYVPQQQAQPQAANPNQQEDAPDVQAVPQQQRGKRGNAQDYYNDGYRDGRNNGRGGFGVLGFIGGIFRFFFTLLVIGLIFGLVRWLFFPHWRGGPFGWRKFGPDGKGGPGGVPPFFAEWHKRAHDAPAEQPKPAESAVETTTTTTVETVVQTPPAESKDDTTGTSV